MQESDIVITGIIHTIFSDVIFHPINTAPLDIYYYSKPDVHISVTSDLNAIHTRCNALFLLIVLQ